MKIKELEELTGISRANIRFYEKEGFLNPARGENSYRDYSDEDKELLLRIKLLRSLDVSLDDIKALQKGDSDLISVLEEHIKTLEQDKNRIVNSQRVCREICDDNADFKTLNAKKYIDSFESEPAYSMSKDVIPKVQSPIRRFIARQIDLAIYSSAVSMLMMLCNVNIERGGRLLSLVISLLAMALMIAIEPILLHFLGTTPGKYIFGLYVVDIDGSKIDYLDALSRTCNVCFYGLGFNVPVISLYRLWKSYKACDECEELPWEYESELQQKRPAVFKSILAFVLSVVLVFSLVYIGLFSVEMPKHRGEISVEQFAENYNKFAAYLGDGNFPVLNPDGTWKKYDSHIYNGYIVDTDSYTQKLGFPDFVYKTDDKGLYEISLHYNTSASFPPDLREQLFICTASFACTVKEYSLRSENRQVLNLVMENPFNSFSYSEDGISVDCKYDYEGYDRKITIYGLLWPEEGKEQRFDMEFVIRKDR